MTSSSPGLARIGPTPRGHCGQRSLPILIPLIGDTIEGEIVCNIERGAKWVVGNYGNTLYNHAGGPNPAGWDCLNATQQKGRMAARGFHGGGVNVLSCDGGVRFVRDGVSAATWPALATRAGGEAAGSNVAGVSAAGRYARHE